MRRIIAAVCVLGVVVAAAVVLAAQARVLSECVSYESNGPLIAGWNWLRSETHTATWVLNTAELVGCAHDKVHLNFSGLCTNGLNGGSGYSADFRCTVRGGDENRKIFVRTFNAYRPQDPNDSQGVGYQVYGSSAALPTALVAGAIEEGRLTIVMTWPPVSAKHHMAVKKDSFCLGYIK